MEENKAKTVGAVALDLQSKGPETRDPIELQRAMQEEYEKNLLECADRGKKEIDDPVFYVVVDTKKERLLENVVRNYFYYRHSCPTPNYDQTVYQYKRADDEFVFLWTVPSRDTCHMFVENALMIAPEEKELLNFILDFRDGKLLVLAQKLNNELEQH